MKYDDLIQQAANQYQIDPNLIRGVAMTESSMNPNAVGPMTKYGQAQGIAQLIPSTAKALGVTNPKDPAQAIPAMAKLLAQNIQRYGNVNDALMAYHGGTDPKNWGPVTQAYPQKVMQNMPNKNQVDPDAAFNAFFGNVSPATSTQKQAVDPDTAYNAFFGNVTTSTNHPAQQVQNPPQQSTFSNLVNKNLDVLKGFGAGLGERFGSTILAGQQLVGKGLSNLGATNVGNYLYQDATKGINALKQQVQPYQQQAPISTAVGQMVGSIAGSAPALAVIPEAAGASLLGLAGRGALGGAISGALTPVTNDQNFGAQKFEQMGTGAALGGIAAPVLGSIGKLISPNVSPDVQYAMSKGVNPTIGQAVGGLPQVVESKATSLPLTGEFIGAAQRRAVGDFNKATYNEVLAPINQALGKTKTYEGPIGTEGITNVKNQISDVFNQVVPKMSFTADQPFVQQLGQLSSLAQSLPEAQQKQFMNIIKTQIADKVSPQGYMDGQQLQGALSSLQKNISGYAKDSSHDNRQLSDALMQAKSIFDDAISRQNPDLAPVYNAANASYANFVRLQKAASGVGAINRGGVITPADLTSAVKASDQSLRKGALATGDALMQDFATKMQNVLGSKYPDSGTAGRIGLATALPGFATAPTATMATLGGLGAAALPYTSMAQPLIAKLIAGERGPLAQAIGGGIQKASPLIAPALLAAIGAH